MPTTETQMLFQDNDFHDDFLLASFGALALVRLRELRAQRAHELRAAAPAPRTPRAAATHLATNPGWSITAAVLQAARVKLFAQAPAH